MNKFWLTATIGCALLVPAGYAQNPAPAEPKEGRVQQRQERQQQRIAQGVSSGQLTPRETARLENKEAAIHREVRHDRQQNGGNLTNKEKAQINHQQNHVSRQIYRQKHDAQHMPK